MSVAAEIKKGCLVVTLGGEIDLLDAEKLHREADYILDNSEINAMVVNMAAVDFIDSSGIGALIGRYKKLRYRKGKMCLVGLKQNVARILNMAGVLGLMEAYPDEETALMAV